MTDEKKEKDDVQGHKQVAGPDQLHVSGADVHVGLHDDGEDDVQGHKMVADPDSLHVGKPETKPEI